MFHELPKGGAEKAVHEIAKGLREKAAIVDLFTTGENVPPITQTIFNEVFFYKLIPKAWQGHNWKRRLYKDTFEMYHLYLLHKKIAMDINKGSYDVIFVNASQFIEAPFVLRFLKRPSVFYAHDPHYRLIYDPLSEIPENLDTGRQLYEKLNRFIRKILDRQNFNKAKVILANSKYTKQMIRKTYGRKSIVAYLGVDTKFFFPAKKKKLYDVLFVGSTSELDGFRLFLDVAKYLPRNIRVRSILAEMEWISSPRAMRDIYQSSKVVLALGVREPFGLVPLEAAACGVPVIAVDEAGYKESIVDGKTGYLLRREPKIIAAKLKVLLANPQKISEMGKNARLHVVQNWTWKKSVDAIYSILS